jgi:hypothetical protein
MVYPERLTTSGIRDRYKLIKPYLTLLTTAQKINLLHYLWER